jgi:hypothetical protein
VSSSRCLAIVLLGVCCVGGCAALLASSSLAGSGQGSCKFWIHTAYSNQYILN